MAYVVDNRVKLAGRIIANQRAEIHIAVSCAVKNGEDGAGDGLIAITAVTVLKADQNVIDIRWTK